MKKYFVVKHQLKQKSIFFQILELFLLPIDIFLCYYKGIKDGGLKYGFGNATIEMRRRYIATLVYPWSIRNYILHVLGVTLMDPFGKHMKMYYDVNGFEWKHHLSTIYSGTTQYLHSMNPKVRKIIKKYLDHCVKNGSEIRY